MAHRRTVARVHQAVLALVADSGYSSLTMEGIAARAEVSKQTLYRSWSSPATILFDALLASTTSKTGEVLVPDTGDLAADLEALLTATVAEMQDPAQDRMMRAVTIEIQSDPQLFTELRARLLDPQTDSVIARLDRAGVPHAEEAVELLYGPVFYRWLLRTKPFDPEWVRSHVRRTLRAMDAPRGAWPPASAQTEGA